MALKDIITSGLAACVTPLYISLAFVIYHVVSTAVAWRRLRHFPGPPAAGLSYLWMVMNDRTGRPSETFTRLNREHGPLVRIGPDYLITDDPEIFRRMNGTRSPYTRSNWYLSSKLDADENSMFTTLDTRAHDKMKAQVAAGYSGRENLALEDGVDSQVAGVIDLIRRKYLTVGEELRPMDLGRVVQYMTLDVITKVAFGKEFGYLATDSDVNKYIETAEAATPVLQLLGEVPYLCRIFFSKFVLKTIGPKPTDKTGLGMLLGIARSVAAPRYGPDAKDERDMLGAFVRHGLTELQASQEVLFQLVAGSDTTATAIRTTLLHLITSPSAYGALKREMAAAIAEGRISSPITHDEARRLPYLQAVIYEGLRMNAPFTGLCPKVVPPEGDTIDGVFVPGGTRIAQNFWGTVRRFDVFGKDADLFRPERWLEADAATRDKMRNTAELAFGYGRWGCAGKNVAFMEMNKIYVELFRNFDIQIVNPDKPWQNVNHGLWLQSQFWVKVTESGGGGTEQGY